MRLNTFRQKPIFQRFVKYTIDSRIYFVWRNGYIKVIPYLVHISAFYLNISRFYFDNYNHLFALFKRQFIFKKNKKYNYTETNISALSRSSSANHLNTLLKHRKDLKPKLYIFKRTGYYIKHRKLFYRKQLKQLHLQHRKDRYLKQLLSLKSKLCILKRKARFSYQKRWALNRKACLLHKKIIYLNRKRIYFKTQRYKLKQQLAVLTLKQYNLKKTWSCLHHEKLDKKSKIDQLIIICRNLCQICLYKKKREINLRSKLTKWLARLRFATWAFNLVIAKQGILTSRARLLWIILKQKQVYLRLQRSYLKLHSSFLNRKVTSLNQKRFNVRQKIRLLNQKRLNFKQQKCYLNRQIRFINQNKLNFLQQKIYLDRQIRFLSQIRLTFRQKRTLLIQKQLNLNRQRMNLKRQLKQKIISFKRKRISCAKQVNARLKYSKPFKNVSQFFNRLPFSKKKVISSKYYTRIKIRKHIRWVKRFFKVVKSLNYSKLFSTFNFTNFYKLKIFNLLLYYNYLRKHFFKARQRPQKLRLKILAKTMKKGLSWSVHLDKQKRGYIFRRLYLFLTSRLFLFKSKQLFLIYYQIWKFKSSRTWFMKNMSRVIFHYKQYNWCKTKLKLKRQYHHKLFFKKPLKDKTKLSKDKTTLRFAYKYLGSYKKRRKQKRYYIRRFMYKFLKKQWNRTEKRKQISAWIQKIKTMPFDIRRKRYSFTFKTKKRFRPWLPWVRLKHKFWTISHAKYKKRRKFIVQILNGLRFRFNISRRKHIHIMYRIQVFKRRLYFPLNPPKVITNYSALLSKTGKLLHHKIEKTFTYVLRKIFFRKFIFKFIKKIIKMYNFNLLIKTPNFTYYLKMNRNNAKTISFWPKRKGKPKRNYYQIKKDKPQRLDGNNHLMHIKYTSSYYLNKRVFNANLSYYQNSYRESNYKTLQTIIIFSFFQTSALPKSGTFLSNRLPMLLVYMLCKYN